MALPTPLRRTTSSVRGSAEHELRLQFNVLVSRFEALLAKLDADSGVSDTNYEGTLGGDVAQVIGFEE